MLERINEILSRISMKCIGIQFDVHAGFDKKYGERIYLQVCYTSPCTKTGEMLEWKGRKYYLSEYMTDDEVIKTAYVAFEQAVKHEVMEGFKVDDIILFNPHINFEELLKVSHKEVKREDTSHLKLV